MIAEGDKAYTIPSNKNIEGDVSPHRWLWLCAHGYAQHNSVKKEKFWTTI